MNSGSGHQHYVIITVRDCLGHGPARVPVPFRRFGLKNYTIIRRRSSCANLFIDRFDIPHTIVCQKCQ
jgi:hypothetical protein